jgi:Toprim domain
MVFGLGRRDLLGLAITEGIEDALSAHEATGLGAWAAGAAGFMPVLAAAVPSYIEAVTVYAHEDKAGQAGAHELAEALDHRGIEIRLEGLGR